VSLIIETNDVQPMAQPEAAVGFDLGVSRLGQFPQADAAAYRAIGIEDLNVRGMAALMRSSSLA
jgi:hypothetical protein